jgi:hypothetical protein
VRRMVRVATAAVVILVTTIGTARALDGHGPLVVIGASHWDVKERCGEPSAIDYVMKQFLQRAYDPISQTPAYSLVPVQQRIWTDNIGPTRLLEYLTCQEGKLIAITTGDDGHQTGEDAESGPGAGVHRAVHPQRAALREGRFHDSPDDASSRLLHGACCALPVSHDAVLRGWDRRRRRGG